MIASKVAGRLRRYRKQGLARSLRIAADTAALTALRLIFRFHPWHAQSPVSARPYRRGLARLVSQLSPARVVEVGCGLGGILSAIDAPDRVGYDMDAGVVRAARFLHGRSIRFREGGFEQVGEQSIDVLIAVNWPHDYPPDQLERWIVPLLPRTRYLVLDRIDPASPAHYRHHHDYAFLRGRAELIRSESLGEQHRHFLLYAVKR